ncbi:MAG TPA: hypothetical protein VGG74_21385 [Kofleriaceae bacterium]|jgi:hypothetical protein
MSDVGLIPCSLELAVQRMLELEASRKGCYSWGAGHWDATHPEQLGMTVGDNGLLGWDCAGAAISYAFMLNRHRPGFNAQPHATITDDLNVDSVIEDADPARGGRLELGELVTIPAPGVLILTPTVRIPAKNFVDPGHVRMVLDATKWNPAAPRYADLVYLECRGPSGRSPGVVRNTGESVDQWDAVWPTHKAAMVRVRARGA